MAAGIIKIGTCLKCGKPVYADNVHGSPANNILLQSCKLGGDCEVDILKTSLVTRYKFSD